MDARADERSQFGLGEARRLPDAPAPLRRRHGRAPALRLALGDALREEGERGTPFLFVPVFMGVGALSYFRLAFEPGWTGLWIAAALALFAALAWRGRALAHGAALAVLFVTIGALAAKFEVTRADTQMNGSEVATRLTGTVVAVQHLANGRVRLVVDILATERPELRYAPSRVRVTARGAPEGIGPGDTVTGVARLMPPSGPVRPGSYDFGFHSYFDGVGAVGFFYYDPERTERPAGAPPPSFRLAAANWIEGVRMAIAGRVRAVLDGAEGEVAATLIAGVRSGIPEDTAEAMRRTGLAHILSISGLHMALVAATVLLGFRAVFGLTPGFSSRHPVRKYGAAGALLACAFYLGISGAEVAAQRSFIMIAVMLTAVLFDREALSLRNLAISAIIVVALRPHEVTGPSFQMSFAATAALIGAYALWRDRRKRPDRPIRRSGAATLARTAWLYVFGLAMTSVVAGLATAIFGAYHFNRVSPWSLPANLAAMPAVSAVVMPFAVMAALAMPFGLERPFLVLMGWGVGFVNGVAHWFSERTVLDAVGAIPGSAVLVLTAGMLALTLLSTRLRVLAIPLLVAGGAMLAARDLPAVLVSEDARLVALPSQGGLAVNRPRPNAFTAQNWLHATATATIVPPERAEVDLSSLPDLTRAGAGFVCAGDVCAARTIGGALVVHVAGTAKEAAVSAWCRLAAVIVFEDATVEEPCAGSGAVALTGRDLARRGSAEIRLARDARPVSSQSIAEPYRPWHGHRRFSREARGLPPYERRDTAEAGE